MPIITINYNKRYLHIYGENYMRQYKSVIYLVKTNTKPNK